EDLPSDYAAFAQKYPNGSDGRLLVNRILGYYETVGTLWKNRLISEDLLFDWLWVPAAWGLVKAIALGMRAEAGNAGLWENFEAMAERELAVAANADRYRPQGHVARRKCVRPCEVRRGAGAEALRGRPHRRRRPPDAGVAPGRR